MLDAYMAELADIISNFDALKAEMEQWYAKRLEDKDVVDEAKQTYDKLMSLCEDGLSSSGKSMKLIKNAIAACPMLFCLVSCPLLF